MHPEPLKIPTDRTIQYTTIIKNLPTANNLKYSYFLLFYFCCHFGKYKRLY